MSLSYDAPCPEGEKVRETAEEESQEKGTTKEENERIHRCIRRQDGERERERQEYILETKEKERRRSLSYVTPTGAVISALPLPLPRFFLSYLSHAPFAGLVSLKSRFSGRDDRYASRNYLLSTAYILTGSHRYRLSRPCH